MTEHASHTEHSSPPTLPAKRDLHRKRKHVLVAAVSGTTALIVIIWALLLPGQLKDMSMLGQAGQQRWQRLRSQTQGANDPFAGPLDATGKELQQIEEEQNANVAATTAPILTQDQVNALRTKIESNGQADQPNDNAAKQ